MRALHYLTVSYRLVTKRKRVSAGYDLQSSARRSTTMADFALTAEQKEFQKWIHEFSEKEIRPVAPEYDETEDFPWPVVKKAAEVGIYSFDFYMQVNSDEGGLMMPIALEELAWGCAGITLGVMGTGLPLAALAASGDYELVMKWVPKMFGTAEDPKLAAFAVTEPNAGSDV